MFSIQECVNKTEEQRKKVKHFMDQHGYFDPKECNIYEGLKRSIQRELSETLHKLSLREILFTPGGLTTGYLATASVYLIPTWLSQKLYTASNSVDLAALLSADVFEPSGGEVTVPVGKVVAHVDGEGPTGTTSSYEGKGATIKLKRITVPIIATNEMIEDNQYSLVEWHTQQAGEAMGRKASDLFLSVLLQTASDGYGDDVTATGANAAETLPGEIFDLFEAVSRTDPDVEPIADTMIITPEAWSHSVAVDATGAYFPTGILPSPPAPGFNLKFHSFDTIFSASSQMGSKGAAGAMTLCKTVLFDRRIAVVTGRKNWLRIENYADPVKDLAGAVITGRQDSVRVVDAAVGVLTEKA